MSSLSWLIPGKLAKAPRPEYSDLIEWQSLGIASIVNLLEEWYSDIVREERAAGFSVLHAPMPDFGAAGVEQLHSTVQWIDAEIGAGRAVLVHCYAGIGRTGTVLTAYLIYKGCGPDAAAAQVAGIYAGPQSDEQVTVLNNYADFVKASQT